MILDVVPQLLRPGDLVVAFAFVRGSDDVLSWQPTRYCPQLIIGQLRKDLWLVLSNGELFDSDFRSKFYRVERFE